MSTIKNDTTQRPKALYVDVEDLDLAPGIRLLEDAGFRVGTLQSRNRETIIRHAVDAEVILLGYAELDADMLEQLPALSLICVGSLGVNNVDVSRATELGIIVTNIPNVSTEEVATHAMALILHMTRQLSFYSKTSNSAAWNERSDTAPRRLSEMTLGILGSGQIGRAVIDRAAPFFGRILAFDPANVDSIEHADISADMWEVVRSSDIISLHMPLLESTRQIVNADFLAQMRPGSFLVNVSRGGLIDSAALRHSLEDGSLAGAALDVLDVEPPQPEHPLSGAPRLILTPHVAYLSGFTEAEYVRIQAQNAASYLLRGIPDTPVN